MRLKIKQNLINFYLQQSYLKAGIVRKWRHIGSSITAFNKFNRLDPKSLLSSLRPSRHQFKKFSSLYATRIREKKEIDGIESNDADFKHYSIARKQKKRQKPIAKWITRYSHKNWQHLSLLFFPFVTAPVEDCGRKAFENETGKCLKISQKKIILVLAAANMHEGDKLTSQRAIYEAAIKLIRLNNKWTWLSFLLWGLRLVFSLGSRPQKSFFPNDNFRIFPSFVSQSI